MLKQSWILKILVPTLHNTHIIMWGTLCSHPQQQHRDISDVTLVHVDDIPIHAPDNLPSPRPTDQLQAQLVPCLLYISR